MMHVATPAQLDALLMRAHCCRDWPVVVGFHIGRCGYCHQVPQIIGPWDEAA